MRARAIALVYCCFGACGGAGGPSPVDAGISGADAGMSDGGASDSGVPPIDGGSPLPDAGSDAGSRDAGPRGEPTPVDCSYLDMPNCWTQTMDAVAACAEQDGAGLFNADRSVCTYPSGQTITFTPPLPSPLDIRTFPFNFTIRTPSGELCASFRRIDIGGGRSNFELDSPLGTFVIDRTDPVNNVFHCPNGESYSYARDCGVDGQPTTSTTGGGDQLDMSIGDFRTSTRLFSCDPP
jgi:hypothetical protein